MLGSIKISKLCHPKLWALIVMVLSVFSSDFSLILLICLPYSTHIQYIHTVSGSIVPGRPGEIESSRAEWQRLLQEVIIRLSWNFLELNLSWKHLGKLEHNLFPLSHPFFPSLFLKMPRPQDCCWESMPETQSSFLLWDRNCRVNAYNVGLSFWQGEESVEKRTEKGKTNRGNS